MIPQRNIKGMKFMKAKALAVAASLAIFTSMPVAVAPAFADMPTGGMLQKLNGAHYETGSRRSRLGARVPSAGTWSAPAQSSQQRTTRPQSYVTKTYATPKERAGVGPRPSRWCGWWMRTQLGGGPEFNVAWNWRNYGRPTHAQVGAVVVWRHHVGIITGRTSNGRWIVKSGNDGNRVRERARSVKGAVFRI